MGWWKRDLTEKATVCFLSMSGRTAKREEDTLAEDTMASVEMVCSGSASGGCDFLREGLRCVLQERMEREVTALVVAERSEQALVRVVAEACLLEFSPRRSG